MSVIIPDWPCPSSIRAVATKRRGGVSVSPWNTLNLAYHVGDNPIAVQQNWQMLSALLRFPSTPQLLQQVHGTEVVDASDNGAFLQADGCYSDQPGLVCTVMTADCLPILICSRQGAEVAALHAGWRGLADGVVARGIARFNSSPEQLMAWLGPAISQAHFEVGEDVYKAFQKNESVWGSREEIESCFRTTKPGHWQCDLYALARLALNSLGVRRIFGGQFCTFSDADLFYSYRRDGQTGRMASLIWIS